MFENIKMLKSKIKVSLRGQPHLYCFFTSCHDCGSYTNDKELRCIEIEEKESDHEWIRDKNGNIFLKYRGVLWKIIKR
jgi:hypothetical protein